MSIFNQEEENLIAQTIANAERNTSGEIRIAVEKHCAGDPMARAVSYFNELGMDKTAQRNGVLIYLSYKDHKFAIIGDKGINQKVPDDFWETTQVAMKAHFLSGNIADGIIAGVSLAGEKLAMFFPHQKDDVNELPDDIIYLDKNKN